jgi:enamine deaminase RidA (YjgF/YER057c/UK114 family)
MTIRIHRLAALALAGLAAAPAFATPREGTQVFMPEDPQRRALWEQWGFADAVVRGDTVYLSGVVAGLHPGETDPSDAYDRAFQQVQAILQRAGSSWDDVLEITTYHVDITGIQAFIAVKNRYVHAPFPTWTAIDVDRLVPDNGLVEIRVTAARRGAGASAPAR